MSRPDLSLTNLSLTKNKQFSSTNSTEQVESNSKALKNNSKKNKNISNLDFKNYNYTQSDNSQINIKHENLLSTSSIEVGSLSNLDITDQEQKILLKELASLQSNLEEKQSNYESNYGNYGTKALREIGPELLIAEKKVNRAKTALYITGGCIIACLVIAGACFGMGALLAPVGGAVAVAAVLFEIGAVMLYVTPLLGFFLGYYAVSYAWAKYELNTHAEGSTKTNFSHKIFQEGEVGEIDSQKEETFLTKKELLEKLRADQKELQKLEDKIRGLEIEHGISTGEDSVYTEECESRFFANQTKKENEIIKFYEKRQNLKQQNGKGKKNNNNEVGEGFAHFLETISYNF